MNLGATDGEHVANGEWYRTAVNRHQVQLSVMMDLAPLGLKPGETAGSGKFVPHALTVRQRHCTAIPASSRRVFARQPAPSQQTMAFGSGLDKCRGAVQIATDTISLCKLHGQLHGTRHGKQRAQCKYVDAEI